MALEKNQIKRWAIGGTLTVVVLWLLNLFVFKGMEATERGTYGDMFGAVNALFSGLAFLGVIIAILLQRVDLGYQREDLRLQRTELQLTLDEMKAQTESFRKQNFESTFFQMLRLHNEIVGSLRLDDDVYGMDTFTPRTPTGRTAIEHLWIGFSEHEKSDIGIAIRNFEEDLQQQLGHYFRNLYRIVLFVAEQAEEGKQEFYASLIRAQLSEHEAKCLFYHCLSQHGKQTLKPLVERFALLEDVDGLVQHRSNLARSAFGAAE